MTETTQFFNPRGIHLGRMIAEERSVADCRPELQLWRGNGIAMVGDRVNNTGPDI